MDLERRELSQPLYGSVNVYRVGDTLVDTGHLAAASHKALASWVADGPDIDNVVLTHPHPDHAGGSLTLSSLAATPHTVFEGVSPILADYDGYLEAIREELRHVGVGFEESAVAAVADAYFTRAEASHDVEVARAVEAGDTVSVGKHECEVLNTPGHNAEHMALWHPDSGTLFAGDLVSPSGHFMFGPLSADVGAYRDSLERVHELDADLLVPGHGPLVSNPNERITDALAKADRAEQGILDAVRESSGPVRAQALARDVFDAGGGSAPFLTYVVSAYLTHLEGRGALTVNRRADGIYAE